MSLYRRGYGPENVKETCRMIEVQHEEFIKAEHLNDKAEALRLLRGYAAEFLYAVPHSNKFKLRETERVLSQSVASVADFDPREASVAFEDLAKYSHNLLEQPWRKEFYKIRLYSGYFVHNIKAHLQNSQEMLIALGYVGIQDDMLVLSRPADPVVLKAFSRDCFVASQECLILSQIWERVQAEIPEFPLTVFEAYETRRNLMGDTTAIVNKLVYEARQRQVQERLEERRREDILNRMRVVEAERVNHSYHNQPYIPENRPSYRTYKSQPNVPVDRLVDLGDERDRDGERLYANYSKKTYEFETDAELANKVRKHTASMGDHKLLDQSASTNSLETPLSTSSSSSSFKSLKHHQDFPKSPTTINHQMSYEPGFDISEPGPSTTSQTHNRLYNKIKDTLTASTKISSLPKSAGVGLPVSELKKKMRPLVKTKVESDTLNDHASAAPPLRSPGEMFTSHYPATVDSFSNSYKSQTQNGRKSASPNYEPYDPNRLLNDNLNSSLENLKEDTTKNIGFSTPRYDKPQAQNYRDRETNLKLQKWACPHCTFHNKPNAKICEICSKSPDFRLESEETESET